MKARELKIKNWLQKKGFVFVFCNTENIESWRQIPEKREYQSEKERANPHRMQREKHHLLERNTIPGWVGYAPQRRVEYPGNARRSAAPAVQTWRSPRRPYYN